ncbi:MFS transporter [Nocardiopsis dassonvillei]|jgi:MFS family permease|uniref:MFS transporter n=1 Tax=Nocardiopsis dassonvillei TaxID=2014 RepID=UPI00102C13AE|nr:MFS transporter [Nocardiopsis dassonvillei]MCP3014096.1 MFS transporter [Nocardiopsis dassonvillei]
MARTGGAGAGLTAPLGHPAFRGLVAGRTLMALGNGMASVALAFAVLDVTGSLTGVGLVVGARSVANVALLLLGGVIADRLPRALVLQGGCALAAFSQAALGALLLTGTASLPLMIALSLVNGAAAAVNLPASAALTPQTVPRELLRQANAAMGVGVQGGMFLGMSAGGVVVGLLGAGWAITADAALFACAGAAFLSVRAARADGPVDTGDANVLRDLREGWSEFVSRPWVWIIVLQFMVVNAGWSAATAVLGPGIADETFGRTAWGLLMAANSVGLLAGGVLAARWQPRRALVYGTALMTAHAVPFLALTGPSPLPVLFAAMFLAGVAVQQFDVAWEVAVQENVPKEKLSRVYSYDALGSFVAMPLGQVAIGPFAERFGPAPALVLVASLTLLATLAAVSSRSVRTLTRS